jgi:hypothetical protein
MTAINVLIREYTTAKIETDKKYVPAQLVNIS